MQPKRLLMIGTDRRIFEEGSAVRARQVEYAKEWDEVHIVVFAKKGNGKRRNTKFEILNPKQVQNSKFETGNSESSGAGFAKSETVVAPNCWAYSTRSWSKFMYPFDAIGLGRFLIEKRGITEITCQDSSLTAMAGISLKKQFKIPLEIQVHEDLSSPNFGFTITNKIRKAMALSYLPKADRIRVVSNRIKNYLVDSLGINEAKISVRPIAVDVERIKNAPIIAGADLHKKYPQFEKIVLMAGRLEKEKNFGLAIRAWVEVIKAVPKAGLIIVGDGSELLRLKEMIVRFNGDFNPMSDLGNSGFVDSIKFENWVDRETLFSYYKTADQFLVTSLFEGYGMALVEAAAAGCPIVSTDVGVAREVGARVVGWNVEEVTKGIVEGLND